MSYRFDIFSTSNSIIGSCFSVALNYQTEDKQNFYNRSKFADNGSCGFLLKPDFLRNPSNNYSPNSPSELDASIFPTWQLKITIISGQHIPRPAGEDKEIIDPYVKVRIRGHPDDEVDIDDKGDKNKKNRGKTEHVSNNGFNPVWNESYEFEIKVVDLALLEFKVKDHSKTGKDKVLGAFCCSLKSIQEGLLFF